MFTNYLAEAKKIYEFNIGIAGELPENCADSLETCLNRYSVASMSAGKKTPIQERPLDFPQLSNCEVTYYEAGLNYPTTPQVLSEYIAQCCDIDRANIIVRNVNEPQEIYQNIKDDGAYEIKLETEDHFSPRCFLYPANTSSPPSPDNTTFTLELTSFESI